MKLHHFIVIEPLVVPMRVRKHGVPTLSRTCRLWTSSTIKTLAFSAHERICERASGVSRMPTECPCTSLGPSM